MQLNIKYLLSHYVTFGQLSAPPINTTIEYHVIDIQTRFKYSALSRQLGVGALVFRLHNSSDGPTHLGAMIGIILGLKIFKLLTGVHNWTCPLRSDTSQTRLSKHCYSRPEILVVLATIASRRHHRPPVRWPSGISPRVLTTDDDQFVFSHFMIFYVFVIGVVAACPTRPVVRSAAAAQRDKGRWPLLMMVMMMVEVVVMVMMMVILLLGTSVNNVCVKY